MPSIKIITANPSVINANKELSISLPLINIGDADASNIFITSAKLATGLPVSPKIFPIFIGNINSHNRNAVSIRFLSSGFITNQKYLLTIRGTYESESNQYGFSVNRYITVPEFTTAPINYLKAEVDVQIEPLIWNYTIINKEPTGSPHNIAGFSLTIAAPVTVTGVPNGWFVETDNISFVAWFAQDQDLPYPNHIRPGTSLSGFQLTSSVIDSESTPYVLTSWRSDTSTSELIATDYVAAPRRIL